MTPAEKLKLLRAQLSQIVPEEEFEQFAERVAGATPTGSETESAFGGSAEEAFSHASRAVQQVGEGADDNDFTSDQIDALEAIVLPRERPVVLIQNNSYKSLPAPWKHFANKEIRQKIQAAIPSVGRINLPNSPQIPYAGTGFVVGKDLLMTNRHVASLFAQGVGRNLVFQPGQTADCDFRKEYAGSQADVHEVKEIVMIHPYWDMALLRIPGVGKNHTPLKLSTLNPDALNGREIAVIGYPAQDPRNNLELQNRIFENKYNVKRLHPGKLRQRATTTSYGNQVLALTHDSSTLGGNSGSAVIDVKTGEVLGLHFAGRYLESNFAVPTAELARDNRIVDTGVNFSGKGATNAEWLAAWSTVESTAGPTLQINSGGGTARDTASRPAQEFIVPLRVSIGSTGRVVVAVEPARATSESSSGDQLVESLKAVEIVGNLASRTGYDPRFLELPRNAAIKMPALTKAGRVVAARLKDDSGVVLKYHHFSVVMHKDRRLALVTAANIDWRKDSREINGKKPSRKELTGLEDNDQEMWAIDSRLDKLHQLPDVFFTKDRKAFDKGHLVRRDDVCWGDTLSEIKKANGDTFHVTNCSPQTGNFNRSTKGTDNWGDLEVLVEKATSADKAIVFSGPVLRESDPVFHGRDDNGKVEVQIPRQYWKILVTKGVRGPEAYGFVLKQDLSEVDFGTAEEMAVPSQWKRFMKPISEIEKLMNGWLSFEHLLLIDQFGQQHVKDLK